MPFSFPEVFVGYLQQPWKHAESHHFALYRLENFKPHNGVTIKLGGLKFNFLPLALENSLMHYSNYAPRRVISLT